MMLAAVIRALPYHVWKCSHMLMGPIFILAVYHTFFVASPLTVGSAPWLLLAAASTVGIIAWYRTLLHKFALHRVVTVEKATPFDGGMDITFRAKRHLPEFSPGQFATLAHNRLFTETHPFTIAGGDNTSRRFVIRAAGDWTCRFVSTVQSGDRFRLGHSAGQFRPQTHKARNEQLWVAGGVGITPFLAALERMQPDDSARITLVYCFRSRLSAGAIEDVEYHASRLPQLNLVILFDEKKEGIIPVSLNEIVRNLPAQAQVYLCGPPGLKALVRRIWQGARMTGRIHSERFDFRGAYGFSDLIYIGKTALYPAKSLARPLKKIRPAA